MKKVAVLLAAATLTATASAQVKFREILRTQVNFGQVNATDPLSPYFIGKNLSAVAWDGSSLFVAGASFDGTGSAVAKVVPQSGTLEGQYQGAGAFGFTLTPATRGIFDLELGGSTLAVAADFGANDVRGLRTFDTSGAALGTSTFGNRSNGVAYDARDGRFYATGLGSGRAFKINSNASTYNDGVRNWDSTTGPIFFSGSTEHRDVVHDGNGTIYYRAANNIRKVTEAGDGQMLTANNTALINVTNSGIAGHNLDLVTGSFGDLLLYNNRSSVSVGQSFLTVINAIDTSGAAVAIEFEFLAAFGAPVNGNGFYDFSYDARTQTLAVADFLANTVYIFQVPAPASAALLGLGGLAAIRRRRA